mgnify:CR=1 FL=1
MAVAVGDRHGYLDCGPADLHWPAHTPECVWVPSRDVPGCSRQASPLVPLWYTEGTTIAGGGN